jgi:hypothetical protein
MKTKFLLENKAWLLDLVAKYRGYFVNLTLEEERVVTSVDFPV